MAGLYQKYFVLKPRGTNDYAIASRVAMLAYADAIDTENPDLCAAIRKWVAEESRRAHSLPKEWEG